MLNLDAPVRSATLAAQVASQVEALIVSGEWPVGTRIPPENALVSSLGVSRNTVREALRSLVHTGMLAKPGPATAPMCAPSASCRCRWSAGCAARS